jgi:peptidylprolyl isomerase domain and WD repeat-containing protein 1
MSDSESEQDASVLGKRARDGPRADVSEDTEMNPPPGPQDEDEDSDDDVGPMPMPEGAPANATTKKKRKGVFGNPFKTRC